MGLCKTNEERPKLPVEHSAVTKYAQGESPQMTSICIRHQVLRVLISKQVEYEKASLTVIFPREDNSIDTRNFVRDSSDSMVYPTDDWPYNHLLSPPTSFRDGTFSGPHFTSFRGTTSHFHDRHDRFQLRQVAKVDIGCSLNTRIHKVSATVR
jgi:hypothetical protein